MLQTDKTTILSTLLNRFTLNRAKHIFVNVLRLNADNITLNMTDLNPKSNHMKYLLRSWICNITAKLLESEQMQVVRLHSKHACELDHAQSKLSCRIPSWDCGNV